MNTSNPDNPIGSSDAESAEDHLMASLKAANPYPAAKQPRSTEAAADTLFERISSRSGHFTPYEAPTDKGQPRRWSVLVAAAAAVVLLAGAVLVFAPGASQPAVAAVQAAAQETADASSGRVVTDFVLDKQEQSEDGHVEGTLTAAFNNNDFAVTLAVDADTTDVAEAEQLAELAQAETRLVDNNLFITVDGQQWMSVEAPEFLRSALVQFTDLRSILDQVEELVEVNEVGETDLDGLAVTHYQSEVDLADESLAQSGWLPGMDGAQAPVDINAEGIVTIDLYVDQDGLMRRVEVSGDAKPDDASIDASATFRVTTNFVDLGSDIEINEPDPASVETLSFDLDE